MKFYRRTVEEYGVHYIKGIVGKIFPENEKLIVHVVDDLSIEYIKNLLNN